MLIIALAADSEERLDMTGDWFTWGNDAATMSRGARALGQGRSE